MIRLQKTFLSRQDHDAVFWLGDLNYRIHVSVPAVEVLEHALADRLDFLLKNDQLNLSREAGDAFVSFQEGTHVCTGRKSAKRADSSSM